MKKQVSTLSLIALAAFSIWQYFTEHKKDTKPPPTTTQQQSQNAVKNTEIFNRTSLLFFNLSHRIRVNQQRVRALGCLRFYARVYKWCLFPD